MLKPELIKLISDRNPHLYQRDAENIVNAILGEIVAAMARGDRVELRDFGTFSVRQWKSRIGRNPRLVSRWPLKRRCIRPSGPARKCAHD